MNRSDSLLYALGEVFLSLNLLSRLAPRSWCFGRRQGFPVSVRLFPRVPRSSTPAGLRKPHLWRLPPCWVPTMRRRPHLHVVVSFRGWIALAGCDSRLRPASFPVYASSQSFGLRCPLGTLRPVLLTGNTRAWGAG